LYYKYETYISLGEVTGMDSVTSTEARDQFAEHLNQVAYRGARIPIRRRGKIMAYLVPPKDIEALEALEDALDAADAAKALKEFEASGEEAPLYRHVRAILGLA